MIHMLEINNTMISPFSSLLANPIIPYDELARHEPAVSLSSIGLLFLGLVVIYLFYSAIEFGVAYLFLDKYLKRKSALLRSILIINLITFPITSILALVIMMAFYETEGVLNVAELFPFIAEFFLLKWQWRKLYDSGMLSLKPSNGKVLIITVAMNLASFVIGLALFQVIF